MHVLRFLRIFVPLLLVAAIVAGAVVVLTSRNDLQRSRKRVDDAWSQLRPALNQRYDALAAANDAVKSIPGPLHQIVDQVGTQYGQWQHLEHDGGSVTSEVVAANDLESLGRRLVLAARAAPRLSTDPAALGKVNTFAALTPPGAATRFDTAVAEFERARNRPARSLAARILGYKSVPAYEGAATA